MKKVTIIGLCVLNFASIYAQSVAPAVNASSGGYYTGNDATLSWTIGEGVVETFTGLNSILTQGFQQPKYTITSIEKAANLDYKISVYPNPTSDLIKVEIESLDNFYFRVELIDLQGKRLHQQNMSGQNNTLDLQQYATGIYILKVFMNVNEFLQSYRISKL